MAFDTAKLVDAAKANPGVVASLLEVVSKEAQSDPNFVPDAIKVATKEMKPFDFVKAHPALLLHLLGLLGGNPALVTHLLGSFT